MAKSPTKTRRPSIVEGFTVVELLVVIAIIVVLIVLLIPCLGNSGSEAARRSQCTNNLKQITLAMHNYHDTHGSLPPAYIADEDGKPMHSWRVLILPYLEQQPLYERYDFNEPWDGPNNRLLHDTIVQGYACPSQPREDSSPTATSYVAIVGPDTVFPADQPTTFDAITDGTSNTLLVVELSASGIHWMEPRDLTVEEMPAVINPGEARSQGISSMHPGGANAARCDGSVHFLHDGLSTKTLRAMLTIAGGEATDASE